MTTLYLITGATGHVGTVLVRELLRRGGKVRALILPGDEKKLPAGVEYTEGDITKPETMKSFFSRKARTEDTGFDRLILIHCAAIITVATAKDPRIYQTNVTGTENVMRLARQNNVDRIICLSSVHAIPEKPKGEVITEVAAFSPEKVDGQYAKTKAEAANIVLGYARQGLNVSIVHPSGVIGPGDLLMKNHMIRVLRDMASGRIPVAVQGGYDFVDSRDVAAGIIACVEKGRAGECYILSGHFTRTDIFHARRRGGNWDIIRGIRKKRFVIRCSTSTRMPADADTQPAGDTGRRRCGTRKRCAAACALHCRRRRARASAKSLALPAAETPAVNAGFFLQPPSDTAVRRQSE